jgi:hypothetical protein
MNKKLVLALTLVACLAACKKVDGSHSAATPPSSEAAATSASAASDTAAPTSAKAANPATDAGPPVVKPDAKPIAMTAPDLAYSYDYAVQAPARDVPHLVREHESECALAGATVCQVVGANTKSQGEDDVAGRLEIRASPVWIARFRDRIEEDVKQLGGKISGAETGTEDLSRSLVDTQAAIRSKTELRDRMEDLLKHHKGKLDDLVQLQTQVSDIQGQIDAANSELAVMKTRVQTSRLVIEYSSMSALGPDSPMHPVAQATHGFARHFAKALAVLIDVASVLLPFGLVGGAIAWFFVARSRKSRPMPPRAPGALS